MKRTDLQTTALALALAVSAPGQEVPKDPEAQPPFLKELVEKIRAAEQAATSVQIELRTSGSYPGGMSFQTRGSLRVLKGAHPRLHARMEFSFEDGITGRLETLKTPEGVWILEDNPTFGEVFWTMDAELVADLEWAAAALGRADGVPGVDRRSSAPLGSSMIADLGSQYRLQVLSRKDRNGQPGRWIGGELRSRLKADADPGTPLPDRVELFARDNDDALLEVVFFEQGKPAQRVEIEKLVVNQPIDPAEFKLNVGERKPKPVREHPPAWNQIERILAEADAKLPGQRPSRKKAEPGGAGETGGKGG